MGQRPRSRHQPLVSTGQAAIVFQQEFFGPGNAAPNGKIAQRFGFTDLGTNGRHGIRSSATMTQLVERMQRAGYPVTRNADGYFWATAPDQFDFEIGDLESRIATWARKLQSAKMARKHFEPTLEWVNR